ncbi:MAG: adenosine deaminase [Bryobacteraceae bacterium]
MGDFFEDLPKAELHLHLEGSLDADTILELAPGLTREEIAARYRTGSFAAFIEAYKWTVGLLTSPACYALAARRLFARLAADRIQYAEVTISAGVVLWKELDFEAVFDALAAEAAQSPIPIRWVLDAIRHFGADHGVRVAKLAASHAERGVVAFGLGGDESRGPASLFEEAFAIARHAGLKLVPHAGENTGAQSVWEAVRAGAFRIGHGIRAVEDPELMALLRERRIPLEICISSNAATGAVASIEDHPLRVLYEAGVPVVLNTDDPGMFGVTLSGEYRIAARKLGFTRQELARMAAESFQYACPAATSPPDPRAGS